MGKSRGRPSRLGGFLPESPGRRPIRRRVSWKWISIGLSAALLLLLLLINPCATHRCMVNRGPARSEQAAAREPVAPESPAGSAGQTVRKRIHTSSREKTPDNGAGFPPVEEEYDFGTRVELITEPRK